MMVVGYFGGYEVGCCLVIWVGWVFNENNCLICIDCVFVGGDFGGLLFDMFG